MNNSSVNLKEYPTQFYGRTFVCWAGILFLGPLVSFYCIIGVTGVLGLDVFQIKNSEEAIRFLFLGLILLPLVIASFFLVYVQ